MCGIVGILGKSAVATRDRLRVLTITTTEDLKRTLTAWGPPPVR